MSKHLDIEWMAHRIATLIGVPDDRFVAFGKRALNGDGTITIFGARMDALEADRMIRQLEKEKEETA